MGTAGNLTFMVSVTDPPRTKLLFVKTPAGLTVRPRPPRVFGAATRRAAVSNLVFTTSRSGPGSAATGTKRYEAGQVLEFDDASNSQSIDPMLVNDVRESRHDTNLLDYEAIGLIGSELDDTLSISTAAYATVIDQLNSAIEARSDAETGLITVRKTIVEVDKAIAALDGVIVVVGADAGLEAIKSGLVARRSVLMSDVVSLTTTANESAALAISLNNRAGTIAQLVR